MTCKNIFFLPCLFLILILAPGECAKDSPASLGDLSTEVIADYEFDDLTSTGIFPLQNNKCNASTNYNPDPGSIGAITNGPSNQSANCSKYQNTWQSNPKFVGNFHAVSPRPVKPAHAVQRSNVEVSKKLI